VAAQLAASQEGPITMKLFTLHAVFMGCFAEFVYALLKTDLVSIAKPTCPVLSVEHSPPFFF
jgi:hypothetical protein